ncbi:hypothetical protein HKX48_004294 [Thoreauomyces humboldtii]|nr:hypothetical protein HKX48_004294 [Thoreauomyces humboldtii]
MNGHLRRPSPDLSSRRSEHLENDLSDLLDRLIKYHPCLSSTPHSDLAGALFTDQPTIRLLQNVAKQDAKREECAKIEDEADTAYAAAYDLESERLERILEVMGVTSHSLSRFGETHLGILADLAFELQLGDVEAISFQSAMADLQLQDIRADMELSKQRRHLGALEDRHAAIDADIARTESVLAGLEDTAEVDRQRVREWTRNADLLMQKGDEYADRVRDVEARIDPDLPYFAPSAILATRRSVERLREDLAVKEEAVRGFVDLPPDPVMAKLKLEERRLELNNLIRRKQDILGSIASGIS